MSFHIWGIQLSLHPTYLIICLVNELIVNKISLDFPDSLGVKDRTKLDFLHISFLSLVNWSFLSFGQRLKSYTLTWKIVYSN